MTSVSRGLESFGRYSDRSSEVLAGLADKVRTAGTPRSQIHPRGDRGGSPSRWAAKEAEMAAPARIGGGGSLRFPTPPPAAGEGQAGTCLLGKARGCTCVCRRQNPLCPHAGARMAP